MSFLAPLFIFGALAVALPILFHLVRQTSREKQTFSSLMFLLPTPPRVTRRSRLEHWLLLAVRCLVLVALSAGFARPFLRRPPPSLAFKPPGRQLAILIDASASMRREGLWKSAQDRLQTVLRNTTSEDQVALFAFERVLRPVMTFEQWQKFPVDERASLAIKTAADLTPGWGSTALDEALISAVEWLENSTGSTQPGDAASGTTAKTVRRIVLISDLQEGCHLERLQGYAWPQGIEVAIETVNPKTTSNAGVQWLSETDGTYAITESAGAKFRIFNAADSTREQFRIGWKTAAGVPITNGVDVYVPPGQNRVIRMPDEKLEPNVEAIQLAGDDCDFDNTAWVVRPPVEAVPIWFVGGRETNDSSQLFYYVNRAFQDSRNQQVRLIGSASPAPAPTNAVLAFLTGSPGAAEAATARQFLATGKNVVCLLDSPAAVEGLSILLDKPGITAPEAAVSGYVLFGQIDFSHPLLAPFADPRFSDFTKIHIWKYRRLALAAIPQALVICRFDNGDPALIDCPVGNGHLFLSTFGWHPTDSQLALSSKFVPLLYSLLERTCPPGRNRLQYWVGDPVDLPAPESGSKMEVKTPGGSVVALAAGTRSFSQTSQPGIYTVLSANPPRQFAVNLDPAESRTTPLPLVELERRGVPLKIPPVIQARQAAAQQARLHAEELEGQQKLWRWLIVTVLILLLIETGIAGWLTRQRAKSA